MVDFGYFFGKRKQADILLTETAPVHYFIKCKFISAEDQQKRTYGITINTDIFIIFSK